MKPAVFESIPVGWRERWELLRAFLEGIYKISLPTVGRVPRAARCLETRIGRKLPPSVTEWMAFTEDIRTTSEAAASDIWPFSFKVVDFPNYNAISINMFRKCMHWMISYDDFGIEDPPVSAHAWVEGKQEYVRRASYGTAPMTEVGLHSIVEAGWQGYCTMSVLLKNPKKFIRELPRTLAVSPSFGSVTIIEGRGWLAFIQDGYGMFGRDKELLLRYRNRITKRLISPAIRNKVGLTPSRA